MKMKASPRNFPQIQALPDEVLRRAHRHLISKVDAEGIPIYPDKDDRDACRLLRKLHLECFAENAHHSFISAVDCASHGTD